MPKKGSTYATIGIDLQKWLSDETERTGELHAQIARRLNINRARIHEMSKGELNTMMYLEIIVSKVYGGDYLKMAKYALTDDGLEVLKDRNFKEKLTPYQRDVYSQAIEKLKKDLLKDTEHFKDKYLKD